MREIFLPTPILATMSEVLLLQCRFRCQIDVYLGVKGARFIPALSNGLPLTAALKRNLCNLRNLRIIPLRALFFHSRQSAWFRGSFVRLPAR